MGKRGRRRGAAEALRAPESTFADPDHGVLVLRGTLTVATRREYAAVREGGAGGAGSLEDAWQRSAEFLFERVAVRWEIGGAEPLTRQRELLGRYRLASSEERQWIREVLRRHLAEHFPDVDAP